jgi:peptidoglycan/LPS O-acetylase OafA/YrhL
MRKYYLDNIRWMTIVVVVVYHVFYMYNAEGLQGVAGKITDLDVQYWDLYQYAVYPWIMPVLFIVSGVCARLFLETHTDKAFLCSRTRKLLVPSTVGLFAFQFLQGYVNVSLGGAFERNPDLPLIAKFLISVASGIGVLWFIQVLWLFSLLLLIVRRFEKGRLYLFFGRTNTLALILLVFPVWGAGQILNTPIICVYRFGFYSAFFLLGYYVFSHETVMDRLKRWCIPLLIAAASLGIAFCAIYFGANYADKPVNRTLLFSAFAWFGCLAVLGGMARYGDFQTRITHWMNDRSFGLYVFHYLGISSVGLFIGKAGLLPAPAVYLLSLLAGFGGGLILNAVISRLPFFRWAVLGISNKAN